jgi:hypothetical protein
VTWTGTVSTVSRAGTRGGSMGAVLDIVGVSVVVPAVVGVGLPATGATAADMAAASVRASQSVVADTPEPAVQSPVAAPNAVPVVPANALAYDFADCPPTGPGITCTVSYLVSRGNFQTAYTYEDHTGEHVIGPSTYSCKQEVCNLTQTGFPGSIGFSVEWEVWGNNATIYDITAP